MPDQRREDRHYAREDWVEKMPLFDVVVVASSFCLIECTLQVTYSVVVLDGDSVGICLVP